MRAVVALTVFMSCLLAFSGCDGVFDDMEQRGRTPDASVFVFGG